MPTSHVSWGSIELFHNVVRTLTHLNQQGHAFPVIRYRAKVKLHGSNCAVQVTADGTFAQSRTSMLTPASDYKGFAAWVRAHEAYFAALPVGAVIFGEWCGPGVEKGMAISALPRKAFVIFAVQVGERVIADPDEIRRLVPATGAPPDLFVLPWEAGEITIDFGSRAAMESAAIALDARVSDVEREDPWVKRAFGISGLGEGLVFYPVSVDDATPKDDPASLSLLMFKAKGDKHRTAGARTAVQVDPTVVASIDELVALMVTEPRLQQGLTAVGGARDPKLTGRFLAWIAADVEKESVAEREAAGLTWAQVDKAVQARARAWFLAR